MAEVIEQVSVVDSPPASAPAPATAPGKPTTSIRVSQMPTPATPEPPPKPGSAKEGLFKALRTKAGVEQPASSPPPTPDPGNKPDAQPAGPTSPADKPGEGAPASPPTSTPPGTITPEEKQNKNPWKLMATWKERAVKAEEEVAQIRTQLVPEADRKKSQERVEAMEKRNKELEDEIRYVNYQKSSEFQDKYQKPYIDAWNRWMNELKEIPVQDEASGTQRAIKPEDVLSLMSLALPNARATAQAMFGDFAEDVMAARKELRSLFDQQDAALSDAKKNGADREKQMLEQHQLNSQRLTDYVKQTWEQVNQEALKHARSKYFKPVEGNDEVNRRLEEGFKLVDQAYSENPAAPNLTQEQRNEIIKRHSAVRNRAAAFASLVYQLEKAQAENASLAKELEKFKGSTPTTTAPSANGTPAPARRSAREELFEALRAKAAR